MLDIKDIEQSPYYERFYRIPAIYYKQWLEKHGGTFTDKIVLDFGCGEGIATIGLSLIS